MTLVVNFFGGPGTGKSTMAAGLFYYLKKEGVEAGFAHEFAKEVVWEGREHLLTKENEFYILAKQLKRIKDLVGKVDVVVCDSPVLMSLAYGDKSEEFENFVVSEHNKFRNFNVFLDYSHPYVEEGRIQTEEEALELHERIREQSFRRATGWCLAATSSEKNLDRILNDVLLFK